MQSNGRTVLHICAVPETAFILLPSLIRQQREEGYLVEVACGQGDHKTASDRLGVPIHPFSLSRSLLSRRNFMATRELVSFIGKRNFDYVHTHTPIASFVGRRAAALAGSKVVIYHMRGTVWGTRPLLGSSFTLLEKIASKWTDHTITINCLDAEDVVRKGIAPRDKVTCIHCGACGLDTEYFNAARLTSETISETRERIRFRDGDYLVTFIGRLVRDKGIFDLLNAFAEAKAADPKLKLLIVGSVLQTERDQSFEASFERWKQRNGWISSNDIIRVGFSSDVRPFLAVANVLVLPSYREGFGMVLAEAAAMGIPSITTDTRGGLEAVVDSKTGLVVQRKRPEQIAAAILKLRSDTAMSSRMGIEARIRAVKELDCRVVYKRVSRIYDQLYCSQLDPAAALLS